LRTANQLLASGWRRFKRFAPDEWQRLNQAPRAENDYATHLPIIIGIAKLRAVRTVLELGSGYYSTVTFLNKDAFPHLQLLHSYETDEEWLQSIKNEVSDDRRVSMALVANEMADVVSSIDIEEYDLILVDDSTSAERRAKTIAALVERRPKRPCVVIHDFEVPAYRAAAGSALTQYRFRTYNPETGVLWHKTSDVGDVCKRLRVILNQHATNVSADDVQAWIRIFNKHNNVC